MTEANLTRWQVYWNTGHGDSGVLPQYFDTAVQGKNAAAVLWQAKLAEGTWDEAATTWSVEVTIRMDSEQFFALVAQEINRITGGHKDGAVDAAAVHTGGGIWCVQFMREDGLIFLWGTANQNWGADVYPSLEQWGELLDSVEIDTESDTEDLSAVAKAIYNASLDYKPSKEGITPDEWKVIDALRSRGYAVIIWTPQELKQATPRHVEDRSIELGWQVIEDLQ